MRIVLLSLFLVGCAHIVADTEYPCSLDTHSFIGFTVDREINCSQMSVRETQDRKSLIKKTTEEYLVEPEDEELTNAD